MLTCQINRFQENNNLKDAHKLTVLTIRVSLPLFFLVYCLKVLSTLIELESSHIFTLIFDQKCIKKFTLNLTADEHVALPISIDVGALVDNLLL